MEGISGAISTEDVKEIFEAIKKDDESVKDILDQINLGYVAITRARKQIGGGGFTKLRNAFIRKPDPKRIIGTIENFQNIFTLLVKEEKPKKGENDFDIFDALF